MHLYQHQRICSMSKQCKHYLSKVTWFLTVKRQSGVKEHSKKSEKWSTFFFLWDWL